MRREVFAVVILLGLAASTPAQDQVELKLDWSVELPKDVNIHLGNLDEWRDKQIKLYVEQLDKALPFWKFTAAAKGKGTLRFAVKPSGSPPRLLATAVIKLPTDLLPRPLWSYAIVSEAGYNDFVNDDVKAAVKLQKVTDWVNNAFFADEQLAANVKELFQVAVADHLLEADDRCFVALPLPWERLKAYAAKAVYKIEAEDGRGVLADPVMAVGSSVPYRDKANREWPKVQPQGSLKGLTVRQIFINPWPKQRPPRVHNPNLDIAGSCP